MASQKISDTGKNCKLTVTMNEFGDFDPTIRVKRGLAWVRMHKDPGLLLSWVMYAPYYDDVFEWFYLTLHNVKDSGKKELFKGATHEVNVYILDPKQKIVLTEEVHCLQPVQFQSQWYSATDKLAIDRIQGCVIGICSGWLDPTLENKEDWIDLFGSLSKDDLSSWSNADTHGSN